MANIETLNKIKYISFILLGTVLLFGIFYFFDELNNSNKEGHTEDSYTHKCAVKDGNHSATVTYYEPGTMNRMLYSWDVLIKNCEIIKIRAYRDGYLESEDIAPLVLDSVHNGRYIDKKGRVFEVHVSD